MEAASGSHGLAHVFKVLATASLLLFGRYGAWLGLCQGWKPRYDQIEPSSSDSIHSFVDVL